ncbi:MAG: hypothetical protein ACM3O3_12505 [Syntrophothermus sp.]
MNIYFLMLKHIDLLKEKGFDVFVEAITKDVEDEIANDVYNHFKNENTGD